MAEFQRFMTYNPKKGTYHPFHIDEEEDYAAPSILKPKEAKFSLSEDAKSAINRNERDRSSDYGFSAFNEDAFKKVIDKLAAEYVTPSELYEFDNNPQPTISGDDLLRVFGDDFDEESSDDDILSRYTPIVRPGNSLFSNVATNELGPVAGEAKRQGMFPVFVTVEGEEIEDAPTEFGRGHSYLSNLKIKDVTQLRELGQRYNKYKNRLMRKYKEGQVPNDLSKRVMHSVLNSYGIRTSDNRTKIIDQVIAPRQQGVSRVIDG